MLNLHRPTSLRIIATTALLFVAGALLTPFVAPASAGVASVSFQQCANGTADPHVCDWINGDVQHSNSVYAEGMSLPQRLLLTGIAATPGNAHTLVFDSQWTKAGKHAYDWLTSYSQAMTTASYFGVPYSSLDECGGLGAACTSVRSGSNYVEFDVPDDPYLSHDGLTQTKINAYESQFGNRKVRLWGSGLTAGTLTVSHTAAPSGDTGDSDAVWTLTWIGSSDVLLEFGAHIAKASSAYGWGSATGAASISGSPYHVSLQSLDGSSLGSMDNQMKSGVLQPPNYIKVIKQLSPSTDPGRFDLQIDGVTKAANQGDGGSTSFVSVATGTHSVGEAGYGTTNLSDYSASTSCTDGTTTTSGSSVTVTEGQMITCTITNTRRQGTLQVVKHLSPTTDSGKFNLLIDGTSRASDVGNNGQTTAITVNTGTHTVGETAGTGTTLSNYTQSISCSDGSGSVTATAATGGWTVPVGPSADVVCIITNTRQTGTITVNKVFSPTIDPGKVNLSVDGTNHATNVGNGGTTGAVTVNTGTNHSVGESAGTATDLADYTSSISCSDGSSGSGTSLSGITVTSTTNVTCTITNTRKTGTLQVIKSLSPTTDPGLFNLLVDGTSRMSNVGNNGQTSAITVNTGTHSFGETAGTGTILSDYTQSVSCMNGRASVTATPVTGGWTVPVGYNDAIVCTITNTRQTGTITVTKAFSPSTDPGLVNLSVDGVNRVSNVGHGGTTGVITVNTGTNHSVGETAGTSTNLADYTSTIACSDGSSGSGTSLSGITVTSGSNVTCTITNTRKTGTLQVIKHLSPTTDPGLFNLLIDGVSRATDVTHNGQTAAITVNTGTHTIGESAGTGTSLSQYTQAVSCADGSGAVTATPLVNGGWSLPVGYNAAVVCTITNTRQTGTITVNKVFSPTGDPGLVNLSIDGTGHATNVGNGGTTGAITVNTGTTHAVAESAGTGTALTDYTTSISCTDGSSGTGAMLTGITVTSSSNVVCTITNTRKTGTLQVVKALAPTGDPGLFNLAIDGTTRATNVTGGGGTSAVTLPTGTHTFNESAGTGTDLSRYTATASCTDGRSAVTATLANGVWSVPVGYGQAVVCTITNTHTTGTLTVSKSVVGGSAPAGGFVFHVVCSLGGWSSTTTLTFTGSGTQTVSGLLTGASCSVTEDPAAGWTSSPGSSTVSIGSGEGAAAQVSFTNTRDTGGLQIAKHAVGHSTSAATFIFDVACSDGAGGNVSINGVTITTDETTGDGTSAALGGIPSGSTCVVTERPTAGWRADSGPQTIVVGAGQVATVSFTNTQLYTEIALTKGVDVDGDGPDDDGALVQPGTPLVYTLTYTNSGNTAATGVVISDSLPANATFDSIADGGTFDAASGLAAWVVDVPAGGSASVHWTVLAQLATEAGQTIDNVATFVGPDNSGSSNPVSNPLPFGDLTLVKAVSPTGSAQYGDTLTYSLTATATGSLDQHSVVITDVVPTGTTYVAGSAACTGTPCTASFDAASNTVSWAVGDLAAGASRAVSFQVTIDRPTPAADGGIPSTVIHNFGVVASVETPETPSNQVDTPVTAVLGVKVTRKPPVKVLPFTGIPLTEGVAWAIGMVLLGAAVTAAARRPRGAHKQ